jgi:hypothetical protein
MEAGTGQGGPFLVDVALAVGHHRDHRRRLQNLTRQRRAAQPAMRLLRLDRPLAPGRRGPFRARPDLRSDQPQTTAARSIDRQNRVQKQAAVAPVPNHAQPPRPAGMPLVVQLARILDRQHMPTAHRRAQPLGAPGTQRRPRYPRVPQPAAKPHLLSTTTRQAAQPDGLLLDHPPVQQAPSLRAAYPRSGPPKIPPLPCPTPHISVGKRRIILPLECATPHPHTESTRRTHRRCVHR